MSNEKTSETAMITASLRALSNYEENEKVSCNDSLAEIFLPDERKTPLMDKNSRTMIKKAIPKGLYEYVIARTKYFDKVFTEALRNSTDQVVFLGAGYDSRPYRFNNLISKTKLFEVDAKPTQEHKVSLLQKNKIAINESLKYVPVDFEKDDLFKALSENGFNKLKKTLFMWEGVTFYLSKNTVIQMLRMIKENSSSGSRVCFDFQTIADNSDLIKTGLEDETIKFGVENGKIETFVSGNGYFVVEHITPKDMEEMFLTLDNGDLFGSIVPIMNFLLIEHQ
ncbi:MAG: class I SAM-dependent methyltransferase [Bacillota bacterium]